MLSAGLAWVFLALAALILRVAFRRRRLPDRRRQP